jgi:NAD(P)-dependent dehydrogenase (short-subunit alcohol dehydrogenase family)
MTLTNGVNGQSEVNGHNTSTEERRPQTQINLAGKVIAITGANRGIGLGIANSCLSNGAEHVFSIDIQETGEEFAEVAQRYPSKLHAIKADVTDETSATKAVESIIAQVGAIHGMVVNAGRTKHKPALDFTAEEINQLWSINLFGAFYCARVAARAFIKLGIKGSIVFTASMASYRPNKRVPSAPYGASKAGVRNMTHTLAMEWAQYNIRVNSVSPGLVNTAMTYWVPQQPDWEQQLKYYGGMPRLAEVEELGGAYVYLLSDAASYTTSIDIPVNGVIGSEYRSWNVLDNADYSSSMLNEVCFGRGCVIGSGWRRNRERRLFLLKLIIVVTLSGHGSKA